MNKKLLYIVKNCNNFFQFMQDTPIEKFKKIKN